MLCSRIIYAAALWYYKHCGEKMPIVIVADEDSIKRFKVKSEGVSVMTFKVFPAVVYMAVCSLPVLLLGV